jgi:predicted GNAT family N-acyltransferase
MSAVAAAFRVSEPVGREEFAQLMDLRWRVLRAPWGQPKGSEQDDREPEAYHLVARSQDGQIIGTGRAHLIDRDTAQIRYMAVDDRYKGYGIGSAILRQFESLLKKRGVKQIILQARNEVLPFYLKHGYVIDRPGHTLYGSIQHTYMHKSLVKN